MITKIDGEMKPNPWKETFTDPQNIVALGVTLISACALFVSITQTRIMSEQRALMYEQAKAAVWPRLSLTISKSHEQINNSIIDYSLVLSNKGVGPAIISGVKVSYKEKVINNWWALFREFEMPDSVDTFISNSPFNNTIVKIGDEYKVLNLKDNLPLANKFFQNSLDIRMEVYYESIYGDKWKLTLDTLGPRTIEIPKEFELLEEDQFLN